MGRSRNKVYEPTHPHFLTCTVLHWLPIFTNQESDNLTIFSYVILENHLHLVTQSDDVGKTMQKFKAYITEGLNAQEGLNIECGC